MKKIIIFLFIITFAVGCSDIRKEKYDDIIANKIESSKKRSNVKKKGYSYYAPRSLRVTKNEGLNDLLTGEKYDYYLYVDLVSYFNKTPLYATNNKDIYYFKEYKFADKYGYLKVIKRENDKYLIEFMYNYAKIEVIVDESDINVALDNAITILSSITYNDNIIKNLMGKNVLKFSEEEFNMFEKANSENDVLEIFEKETEEEEKFDPDLVN